ncbi:uncharacterized protein LOC113510724 [Galleria mellonella]|uniref:Uncharacterized protein LOC113510724 n=1 Tax=Galleria mellonella TaxID=7137 RepID=A0A6J1WGT1_GALME|nr:uncharacterized protein LOC113510724 [Galleria mellonella]
MQGNRSRSRSPIRSQSINDNAANNDNSKNCLYLFVGNLPTHWDHIKIKMFVSDTCRSSIISKSLKFVKVLKDLRNRSKGECILKFSSPNACIMAFKLLKGVDCEDKKLVVMLDSGELFEQLTSDTRKTTQYNDKPALNKNLPTNSHPSLNTNNAKPVDVTNVQGMHETYGLSLTFLQTLGIKLPLQKRVFVRNLPSNIEEDQLRHIFGYAGQVYAVMIVRQNRENEEKLFAKIEYDHPVEAVQAVSMFHGQEYMSKKLHVQMDNNPNANFQYLPRELKTVGPGLGPNGEPLRNVRSAVEFEPVKQLLLQELAKLQTMKLQEGNMSSMAVNQVIPQDNTMGIMNNMMNFQNPMGLLNVNAFNPLSQQSWYGLSNLMSNQGTQNLQVMQGLLQQSMGNDLSGLQIQNMPNTTQSLLGNMSQNQWNTTSQNLLTNMSQNIAQNRSDNMDSYSQKNQTRHRDRKISEDDDHYEKSYDKFDIERLSYANSKFNKDSDSYRRSATPKKSDDSDRNIMSSSGMLIFTDLPSSVTIKALSSKMSEVGEVKFAEMTGQNRAIVRFTNARDAERCVRLFDRSKVDGQIIHVKFL